ncbi:MAG: D-alanine--D-alanine ligase [Acidobacteria bacterium]|nr:D-alanine--D-alanine ligase [Acidobacteriota bacterium]
MKITILHADVSAESGEDERDALVQAAAIRRSLLELGHEVALMPATLDLRKMETDLGAAKPDLVFNLVESLGGTGRLLHLAPALLEHLSIPFTGAGSESLYLTTGKLLTKERLRYRGIATPDWTAASGTMDSDMDFPPPYIIKPAWEDASVGVDDTSIVYTREILTQAFEEKKKRFGDCFVESFIDGREFNLSLLEGKRGVQVLPPAEILFSKFPDGKPGIVGYSAKWEPGSFEYRCTPRNFDFPEDEASLLGELGEISRRCWDIFNLRGYARIDFRVDRHSRPWVIEINANPCISPDAGFVAAIRRAGLSYNRMIECILESASLS